MHDGSKRRKNHLLFGSFAADCDGLQDEMVDLGQIYLSVAALSGVVTFKSLLHNAFAVSAYFSGNDLKKFSVHQSDSLNAPLLFRSCSTETVKAVWVKWSCRTSWGRCWAFLSASRLSCTPTRPAKAGSAKVGPSGIYGDGKLRIKHFDTFLGHRTAFCF